MMPRLTSIAIGLSTVLSVAAASDACAEKLIVSVSNYRVTVTPNYSGEELVLFGSIEKDNILQTTRANYDLVVTISGPLMRWARMRVTGSAISRDCGSARFSGTTSVPQSAR